MSNKKLIIAVLSALLVSCAREAVRTDEAALLDAINSGLLLEMGQLGSDEDIFDTATAEMMSLERYFEGNVGLFIPVQRDLYFKRDMGRLVGIYVSQGDRVQKGDVLAEVVFDQEALAAEKEQFLLRMRQFEREYDIENARYTNEIARMRDDAANTENDSEAEVRQLKIQKTELEYQRFLYRSANTRADYLKELAEIDERIAGEQILAPYDGYIRYVTTVIRPDGIVRNWNLIVTVVNDADIQMSVEGGIDVFRFNDTFMVEDYRNGDIRFEARVASDPIVTDTRRGQYMYVLEPTDFNAFFEMLRENGVDPAYLHRQSFNIGAKPLAYKIADALVVPQHAVYSDDKNYVYLYEDEMLKKRYVVTGFTAFGYTQILDGLTEGQRVVLIH